MPSAIVTLRWRIQDPAPGVLELTRSPFEKRAVVRSCAGVRGQPAGQLRGYRSMVLIAFLNSTATRSRYVQIPVLSGVSRRFVRSCFQAFS